MSLSAPMPLHTPPSSKSKGWRGAIFGAMDGVAVTIPFSLGCVTLVFSRIGPGYVASGVFATMLALAWIHLTTARNARPMVYSGRFFEATLLATMLDQAIIRLPDWYLHDTAGVRLAMLCIIGAGAGVFVGFLYAMRAARFTRYIPAPVFAGFFNSIAIALVISQLTELHGLATDGAPMFVVISVAAVAAGAGFVVRRWRPAWPMAAMGLTAGLLLGLGWEAAGYHSPIVIPGGWSLTLPIMMADFSALAGPRVETWQLARTLALDAATLGVILFTNTTMTSQTLTQIDGQRDRTRIASFSMISSMALGGFIGAVPMPASIQASTSAARTSRLRPAVVLHIALLIAAIYLSGVLGWVPLAAVCGSLLREALVMVDMNSVRLAGNWLRRRRLGANAREDLALVVAVTATSLLVNLVAAVFVGLVLGLALFAVRNAARPVRRVWTGSEMSSNCARSRSDLKLLTDHGERIKVFDLEGDLFFGSCEALEVAVQNGSRGADVVVIDWSRVRHIDSSIATSVANLERELTADGMRVLHAVVDATDEGVGRELRLVLPTAHFEHDLDYALEHAENEIVDRYRSADEAEVTTSLETFALFQGLSTEERALLQEAMPERFYARGAVIINSGEASDELLLVLHGSASILVGNAVGGTVRLAGVRRGATIGEVGFLDGSPRSATVVAQEDMVLTVLSRDAYERLSESHPHIVRQMLSNITIDVATRLRHTNRLALARSANR